MGFRGLSLKFTRGLALFSLVGLVGCAGNGEFRDEFDPWEGFNRGVYSFNKTVDTYALKPVAQGYRYVTPDFVDTGVTNFFNNINELFVSANDLLQFKFKRAGTDLGRFAINSTIGVLGLIDVASDLGMRRNDEDFGQTLGAYGVGAGNYLVLPFLGPSSVRDAVGVGVKLYSDPLNLIDPSVVQYAVYGLRIVDDRADLLDAENVLKTAALDEYIFVRDAYLQKRRDLVYDGNPPPEPDYIDDLPPIP
ncbi:MAG: VacJ family lipoprotein [Chromatiales bacterium]|nr:VacJ family lipoprotein [Chromatiales bacterium]